MDKLLIQGGHRLAGEVVISGAKNAALPELCAALLTCDPVVLHNVPHLQDVLTMTQLVSHMGTRAERTQNGGMLLHAPDTLLPEAPYELVKTMRASIFGLGAVAGAFWQSPGVVARRLCHRLASGGPAHQRPGGHGCRH